MDDGALNKTIIGFEAVKRMIGAGEIAPNEAANQLGILIADLRKHIGQEEIQSKGGDEK